MSIIRSALLYTALMLGANAAVADVTALQALREGGSMQKLGIHSEPKPAGQAVFTDADGGEHTLAEYHGQVVVLNFWATWCAPCRKEMPALDALQRELGGADLQVVTIATGRNKLPAIRKFFDEAGGVTALPVLLDPRQTLAREMGVLGLPATVVLNREGQEVARLVGDAEWNSESAKAILRALMTMEPAEG